MNRYLINISYIGTLFRGSQRQVRYTKLIQSDSSTIQGMVEYSLKNLNPVNIQFGSISSRTDSGVHALHNCMHVNLEAFKGKYSTNYITDTLNKHFNKTEVPIRVLSTYLVPDDFHSSYAESRTYLYRLAICNCERVPETISFHIPIEEQYRMHFIRSKTFDVEKFKAAAKLLLGLNDFRSFMGKSTKNPEKVTRKIMYRCEIEETTPKCYDPFSWQEHVNQHDYKFYNIYLEANGFLYKQVSTVNSNKIETNDIAR